MDCNTRGSLNFKSLAIPDILSFNDMDRKLGSRACNPIIYSIYNNIIDVY